MFRGGGTQAQSIAIAANSRETINVNTAVGAGKDVSIKVESSQPIVAERPIYFNYKGVWAGGHNTIGATSTSNVWYFAEGYTGDGFEEWLTIQNPSGSTAHTTVTYMFKGGGTQSQSIAIAANSRETISVNTAVGAGKDVSIKVESTQPIVAERPMYFNYKGSWAGGHNTTGSIE
jgi:predicted small secreted protein